MLNFAAGPSFTTGSASFFDRDQSSSESTAKIFVSVEPNGLGAQVLAQLDTGAAWSILNTEIAQELALLGRGGEEVSLHTRQGTVTGRLERLPLTILAEVGESLEVDATVFVSPDWLGPNFLGYAGLLERIRFALDPQARVFHFGGYS